MAAYRLAHPLPRIRSRFESPGAALLAGWVVAAVLLGAAAAEAAPAAAPAGPADLAGHWEGPIELPGMKLVVKVDLALADGAWTGTIDIPAQGVAGLALKGIRAEGDSLRFAIAGVPGDPTFHGLRSGQTVAGTFTQASQSFPFHLGREQLAPKPRPQDPKPPLPYREEEVRYESGADRTLFSSGRPANEPAAVLAATLTLPPGKGPFPAAVLITGSGPQNRDEELFEHRPFRVLADHLTRAGIAVLRADDRGIGGSTGSFVTATTSDFADDALAGLRYLRSRPEIDPARIGFVGHSEGGIAGPLAASRAPGEVAFLVLIAGTGVPLDEIILRQSDLISLAAGQDSAQVASDGASTKRMLQMVKAGADSAALRGVLEQMGREQMAALPEAERPPEAQVRAKLDQDLASMLSPWFRFAVSHDPRPTLREVRCPVLAVNGTLDLQVDPEQNLPEIEKALREGGNPDVTIVRLPGLNHILQTAKTGHPSEYGEIEETMSPDALRIIGDWIVARVEAGGQ